MSDPRETTGAPWWVLLIVGLFGGAGTVTGILAYVDTRDSVQRNASASADLVEASVVEKNLKIEEARLQVETTKRETAELNLSVEKARLVLEREKLANRSSLAAVLNSKFELISKIQGVLNESGDTLPPKIKDALSDLLEEGKTIRLVGPVYSRSGAKNILAVLSHKVVHQGQDPWLYVIVRGDGSVIEIPAGNGKDAPEEKKDDGEPSSDSAGKSDE